MARGENAVPSFLSDGGELGQLIAGFDWSRTTLGPVAQWPYVLCNTISLILSSTVPIVTLWGEDGVMIYNDAYSGFAGARHPQLLGSRVREGWPEVADFNDHVMKTGLSGKTLAFRDQHLVLSRSGQAESVWMNLDYSPIRDECGVPCAVMAVVVETTGKVKAEQALRESEAQFRTFAQAMPNQVWASQPDGLLDWFNHRVSAYAGYTPDELGGHGWARMVHPEDLAGAQQKWGQSLLSGEHYETEFRLRDRHGDYRWHIARAMPIRDEAGTIVRWVGTNTDIEEQKSTAQALAHLNQTLEQQVAERTADRDRMWRLSTDVMLVADLQGHIQSVNPAWTTVLGWSEAELKSRSFMEFVHPEDVAATLAEVGRLAQGATTFRFENRYVRKDGGYCVLSWTAVPSDRFLHAVGRDVTADREAAQSLRRTEAALHQAQKMETVGQLTGGVAHDFNNLLQVIAGNLQLLSREVAGNARAERQVANALAGAQRGAKLSSQLLAFARRQPLEPRVIKLGRLVAGMDEMLRRTIGDSIEMETVVSGGLWNTLVDPAQLENVLLNLAINARDAMEGVGKLTIEVGNAHLDDSYALDHADVKAGQYVLLAVTDTGSGMAPEVAARAFEPFFSTKPEGKGTGLGLSMVYGFVKQSGGHVKIYSELGQGTSMKLYLPRTLEAEDTAAPPEPGTATGGSETILVAEDDEQVRATVVEMLGELGYRVLTAGDASGALAVLQSGAQIDVLFTDVVMPGTMRSPELARRAREILPGIAVLFTSGYTQNAIVHGGRLDPGVELLGKPYTQEALARKIRHVIANQQQRRMALLPVKPIIAAPQPASLRILFVEDDELVRSSSAELLCLLGHEVRAVGSGGEAISALAQQHFDALVTDIGLPDMTGQALAAAARQHYPGIGVVFASGAPVAVLPARTVALVKPYDADSVVQALSDVTGTRSAVG